jgi:hypothetical protein
MLGKLSIAGAVLILFAPTTLSAQGVGGAVNAGAAVRGAVVRGSRPQRISGLRVRRILKDEIVRLQNWRPIYVRSSGPPPTLRESGAATCVAS